MNSWPQTKEDKENWKFLDQMFTRNGVGPMTNDVLTTIRQLARIVESLEDRIDSLNQEAK